MYITVRDRPGRSATPGAKAPRVAGTVLLLGTVSLLTDISSESVNAILSVYLVTYLGYTTFAYGILDSIYQGVSAVVRLAGGWVADRTEQPKWVAVFGYGLSAIVRVGLIFWSSFAAISAVITLDRLGKGVRTAPRDALITTSSRPENLGRSFGVHRSLDTVGAMLGPLFAFWILVLVPNGFTTVFVMSFGFALVGVVILLLFVPNLRPTLRRGPRPASAARVRTPIPAADRPSLKLLGRPGFIRLGITAGLLGLLTISDSFLYLELAHRDELAVKYFPLLFVGSNIAYLLFAVPLGQLADRIGRVKVFLGGHIALLLAYLCAGGGWKGTVTTVACLLLLGTYYAATDGVLAAISGQLVPPAIRTSGIATTQTLQALARAGASLAFGFMWAQLGPITALRIMIGLLIVVLPIAGLLLRGTERSAPPVDSEVVPA